MLNTGHIRKKLRSLHLGVRKAIQMTFDAELRRQMRSLWVRKRVTDPALDNLGDFYEDAFREYLEVVKVPKQVRKVIRQTSRVYAREQVAEQLQQLQKIAIKRQQPLAVVIEEALQRYLDKPENYLGANQAPRERVQRIV
jgi:pyruvate-formate lyase